MKPVVEPNRRQVKHAGGTCCSCEKVVLRSVRLHSPSEYYAPENIMQNARAEHSRRGSSCPARGASDHKEEQQDGRQQRRRHSRRQGSKILFSLRLTINKTIEHTQLIQHMYFENKVEEVRQKVIGNCTCLIDEKLFIGVVYVVL